jgi:hypothetical protein
MAARLRRASTQGNRVRLVAGTHLPEPEPVIEEPIEEEVAPEDEEAIPVVFPTPSDELVTPPGCVWLLDIVTGEPRVLQCG